MMTIDLSRAQVTLPNDQAVQVRRLFKAPLELVHRAYMTPELLKRWLLGPPGWTMTVCEMDTRVGGQYRWRWRNSENGQEFGFTGVFREVLAGHRYVHTQVYDPGTVGGEMGGEAIITLEFEERDGCTIITSTMDFGSSEARTAATSTGMTEGMEMSYQLLDGLLAQLASQA